MGIEHIHRWAWCLIGLVVGGIVASVGQWSGPSLRHGAETTTPHEFEQQVIYGRKIRGKGRVISIHNIRLHPPTEFRNLQDPTQVSNQEIISFDGSVLVDSKTKQQEPYSGFVVLNSRRPKEQSVVGDLKNITAKDYLLKLRDYVDGLDAKKYPFKNTIKFREAWIENPKVAYTVYPLGGLLLIGIIWPTILNFLVGAGFGRAAEEESEDLSKYKPKAVEAAKPKPGMTDEDMDKLAALEAQLEASLKEGALASADAAPVAAAKAAPAPVRKLVAGTAAELPKNEQAGKPEKNKAYGADQEDYYPTEIHGKH